MKYQAIEKRVSSARRFRIRDRLFIIVVVLPLIASILYFGFLASDIYVSESKFVVRSPDKPASTGLGVILKSAGFANAGDEIYAAQSFAVSRDALLAINRNGAFNRSHRVSRFNSSWRHLRPVPESSTSITPGAITIVRIIRL